ncbi:hypothetical protein BHC48_02975 [Snodgrassella communis]|uniref:Uncharacterized protein n=1 Tax=Snodgrassella alvi TaxID=1196083 RepID=A0A2N9XT48_9NEIS|nr:hypothetical protein BHC48_02975 [Snodgrassella communis]
MYNAIFCIFAQLLANEFDVLNTYNFFIANGNKEKVTTLIMFLSCRIFEKLQTIKLNKKYCVTTCLKKYILTFTLNLSFTAT